MFAGLFEPMHLLVILGIVMIIFGPGKLSTIGRDLGKSVRDFKAAMDGHESAPQVAEARTEAAEAVAEKTGAAG